LFKSSTDRQTFQSRRLRNTCACSASPIRYEVTGGPIPSAAYYLDQISVQKGRAIIDITVTAQGSPFPRALEVHLARVVVGRLRDIS
jgi:hypothetical protein